MAATTVTWYLSNGQMLSSYHSANAVGSYVRCSITGTAGAASPFEFQVSSPCCISDIVTDANAVTGACQFQNIKTGVNTNNKNIDLDARFLVAVDFRQKFIPRICFKPGEIYRIMQTVIQA